MDVERYDVTIIGGGPGGYVAAIRAAQLGFNVACIDKRGRFGGTCLNIGCIPSKALLKSSEKFAEVRHGLAAHGVRVGDVALDLDAMMDRKRQVVEDLTKGIEFLLRKNHVTPITGTACLRAADRVSVEEETGKRRDIETGSVIIATGSSPVDIPGLTVDEKQIVTSTGALSLSKPPDKLALIGAGYIGLEMGSVWSRLGSEVVVIEYCDRILPGMDGEVATAFEKILTRQGLSFQPATKVTGAKASRSGVKLTLEPAQGGKTKHLACDVVLVAVGRRPYTTGLGLEEVGVDLDQRGFIQVDSTFRTTVPGVYAIGDCIPGPMLAHKAEDEGVACAEIIAGQSSHVNYDVIPGIIYTTPEVASVGKTEEQLKAGNVEYKIGKFPFSANGRARCNMATEGFVKILADAKTDRILGGHVLGDDAGSLIAEIVSVMEFGGSAEDIARTCHGHPTLSESVKEAALAVDHRSIHI